MSRDPSYLSDIVEAARLAIGFVEGVSEDQFLNDPMRQAAVVRQLEVIGEAAKRLSEEFRTAHAEIPWRRIAGMRDILIHAYDHVDLVEVWNVVQRDLPSLVAALGRFEPHQEDT